MKQIIKPAQRLNKLPVFLMEQIVKQYRQEAQKALKAAAAGINVDQWIVLKQVSENNGCSQVEIAESTVKDAPSTTRTIDQLVSKKLIAKQLDPNDRRKYMVFVTDQGNQLIERLLPVVQSYRKLPVKGFSEEEQKNLLQLLNRMLKNLA
jgi:MarR family transcriptional regulator for hemolysin